MSDVDPYAPKTPEEIAAQFFVAEPQIAPTPEEVAEVVSEAEQIEAILEAPTGTIAEILDWVGGNPDRAEIALDAELSGQNRKNLVRQLRAIAL